jgi:hypothetical protein
VFYVRLVGGRFGKLLNEKEMEKVNANCNVEVFCNCPYCGAFEDVFEDVRESMDDDHRAENIDVEVECSECGNAFIVDNVYF